MCIRDSGRALLEHFVKSGVAVEEAEDSHD
jgi:hypothetical protein